MSRHEWRCIIDQTASRLRDQRPFPSAHYGQSERMAQWRLDVLACAVAFAQNGRRFDPQAFYRAAGLQR